jgi:hypothetical protein
VAAAVLLAVALAGCGGDVTAGGDPASGAGEPARWVEGAVPLPAAPVRPSPPPLVASTPATPPAQAAPAPTPGPGPTRFDPCPPLLSQRSAVRMEASAATGTLVVSWWHGDPAAVAYYVGVQPRVWVRGSGDTLLTESPIRWTKVAPARGCTTMRQRFPGLRRGVDYTVWLEAEATTPETTPDVFRMGVARVWGVRLP